MTYVSISAMFTVLDDGSFKHLDVKIIGAPPGDCRPYLRQMERALINHAAIDQARRNDQPMQPIDEMELSEG